MRFDIDRGQGGRDAARRAERPTGHDGYLAAVPADQIFGELCQQLAGRRLIGPVGSIKKTDVHETVARARGCARYHSTVFRKPSSNFVFAENPKASRARLTSRQRRGWPSGLVGSNTSRPLYPHRPAIRSARSLMEISKPAPMFTGSGALYRSAASAIASAQSSTYRNSRVAFPVPQQTTSRVPRSAASTHLRISAGMTCDDAGSKLSCGP